MVQAEAQITRHADSRMHARGISMQAVEAVISFGRSFELHEASIYVIRRKEIRRFKGEGVDLSEFEGIHVVCGEEGRVLTVYRDRNLRGLHQKLRCLH